jgi:IS5 family transposase
MATSIDDFFRSHSDQMIDLLHPLAMLVSRMPWQEIESALALRFSRAARQTV